MLRLTMHDSLWCDIEVCRFYLVLSHDAWFLISKGLHKTLKLVNIRSGVSTEDGLNNCAAILCCTGAEPLCWSINCSEKLLQVIWLRILRLVLDWFVRALL